MKRTVSLVGALAILSVAAVASAGLRGSNTVYIDLAGKSASGALGSARNTSNSVEYLEVVLQASATNKNAYIFARDASNQFAYCYTTTASMIDVAASATTDSYVAIRWDDNHNCTSVEVRASSYQPPKSQ